MNKKIEIFRWGSVLMASLCFVMAFSQTNGDAIIYPQNYIGNKVEHFYYDVKNLVDKVHDVNKANNLYVKDEMNGIRVPIFGNINQPAHPSAGTVIESYYTSILKSIQFAKAARGDKDFYVFASKKLNGQNSFPEWTKNANGVIVQEYVKLLLDYIIFMKQNGVEIDYLGIQNEDEFNEGNISAAEHAAIVESIRDLSVQYNFKMPKIVGWEGYGPGNGNWVGTLNNLGKLDCMDIYGTHYYPHLRPQSKLKADLNIIGDIPFWSTEPHWDSKSAVDDWDEAEAGICALWDQVDVGMSGFMWWVYNRSGSLRGDLMREFSVPLMGATNIDMDDIDGKGTKTYGKLQTRAFREGNVITVYAVNNNASQSYSNYGFGLNAGYITGEVSYKQWVKSVGTNANFGTLIPENEDKKFRFTLPPNSFTSFTFEFSESTVGIEGLNPVQGMFVYPSNATDFIHISGLIEGEYVAIYDIVGKQVMTTNKSREEVSHLLNGLYIVKSINGQTSKFIKK